MATNWFKCEICGYVGEKKEFDTDDGSRCPNPVSHRRDDREDVFPYRVYRCLDCGFEGDFCHFFGCATDIDDDPLERGLQAVCGADEHAEGGCSNKVTVVQIR